ncbi:hypothetical protein [Rathayibacter soli]|uniref:hypothetical protein n=1 Tax=Rathayibacter soli TaxID=3144168 RepID=UPI0027E3CABD|nr:hypothetical protein [Glaciibacter superstes]
MTTLEITFAEQTEATPTLGSRAKYLGLELDEAELTDLVLKRGKRQALDNETDASRNSRQIVTIANIDQMKALLGQPDDYWPGDHPRYGVMVSEFPDEVRTRDEENITLSTRFALREYVHGNSRAVAGWKEHLSGIVAQSPFQFPVWLYRTVDVGAGCLLQIGAAGLFCGTLRVHRTGKVRIEGGGPTFVDVLAYEQYGLLEGPIATSVHVKI